MKTSYDTVAATSHQQEAQHIYSAARRHLEYGHVNTAIFYQQLAAIHSNIARTYNGSNNHYL